MMYMALRCECSPLVILGASRVSDLDVCYLRIRGFEARATHSTTREHPGVIAQVITVDRSPLVKGFVIIIVLAVCKLQCLKGCNLCLLNCSFQGLVTLLFACLTVCILCGYKFDIGLLLVPVTTLFTITSLRATMPGAPPGFGGNDLWLSMHLIPT